MTMKELLIILFVFLSFGLTAQSDIDLIEELNELAQSESGRIYLIYQTKDSTSNTIDTFYIAIIPDEWEIYSFKVGYGYSPNGQTEFEVSPKMVKPVKHGVSSYTIEGYKNHPDVLDVQPIAFVEVPARYVSFKPVNIIENGDTITTVPTQKVQARRLVRKGGLKYVSKEEAMKMNKNDVYILTGNIRIREHFPVCGWSSRPAIDEIQNALNEKGYICPIDGVLGRSTKDALLQLQKDNNLTEGRLDIDTLKILGVL